MTLDEFALLAAPRRTPDPGLVDDGGPLPRRTPTRAGGTVTEPADTEPELDTEDQGAGEGLGGRGWVELPALGGAMLTHPDDE